MMLDTEIQNWFWSLHHHMQRYAQPPQLLGDNCTVPRLSKLPSMASGSTTQTHEGRRQRSSFGCVDTRPTPSASYDCSTATVAEGGCVCTIACMYACLCVWTHTHTNTHTVTSCGAGCGEEQKRAALHNTTQHGMVASTARLPRMLSSPAFRYSTCR